MDRVHSRGGVHVVELALLAGFVHHIALQYPKQKSLFETIAGFAVIESAGAAALFFTHNLQLRSLLEFTWCYVLLTDVRRDRLTLRLESSSSSRSFIMFTFVIGGFPGSGGFVRVIGRFIPCIMVTDRTCVSARCTMKWVTTCIDPAYRRRLYPPAAELYFHLHG